MKKLLQALLLFTFFINLNLSAQDLTVSGIVKDKTTGKSIPYVNIGFMGTMTGTVSDSLGNFTLKIPEKHKNDSVSILAVGYYNRKLSVEQFLNIKGAALKLEPKSFVLREISVKAKKKQKETKLGINKGQTNYYTRVGYYGIILSNYIEPLQTNKPYFIKNFKFYGYGWQDNPKLRIRIQKKDSIYNIPGEDITNENIIVSPKEKWGWMEFDLSKHNIYIDSGGFFITLELLEFVPKFTEEKGIKIQEGYTVGTKKMKKKPFYCLHKAAYFSAYFDFTFSFGFAGSKGGFFILSFGGKPMREYITK